MTAEDWQRIEGAIIAVVALVLTFMVNAGLGWWVWIVVLLAPDLSMLGYLLGARTGAAVYNLFHLYAGGLLLLLIGMVLGATALMTFGLLWLVHVGADRALGFGLKQPTGFADTHLGKLHSGAD